MYDYIKDLNGKVWDSIWSVVAKLTKSIDNKVANNLIENTWDLIDNSINRSMIKSSLNNYEY